MNKKLRLIILLIIATSLLGANKSDATNIPAHVKIFNTLNLAQGKAKIDGRLGMILVDQKKSDDKISENGKRLCLSILKDYDESGIDWSALKKRFESSSDPLRNTDYMRFNNCRDLVSGGSFSNSIYSYFISLANIETDPIKSEKLTLIGLGVYFSDPYALNSINEGVGGLRNLLSYDDWKSIVLIRNKNPQFKRALEEVLALDEGENYRFKEFDAAMRLVYVKGFSSVVSNGLEKTCLQIDSPEFSEQRYMFSHLISGIKYRQNFYRHDTSDVDAMIKRMIENSRSTDLRRFLEIVMSSECFEVNYCHEPSELTELKPLLKK